MTNRDKPPFVKHLSGLLFFCLVVRLCLAVLFYLPDWTGLHMNMNATKYSIAPDAVFVDAENYKGERGTKQGKFRLMYVTRQTTMEWMEWLACTVPLFVLLFLFLLFLLLFVGTVVVAEGTTNRSIRKWPWPLGQS